jgi:hypothetical protein
MCNSKTPAGLRARPVCADESCCIHFEQSHTIWSTESERGARLWWNAHRRTRRGGAQIPSRAGVAQGARGRRLGLGAVMPPRRREKAGIARVGRWLKASWRAASAQMAKGIGGLTTDVDVAAAQITGRIRRCRSVFVR